LPDDADGSVCGVAGSAYSTRGSVYGVAGSAYNARGSVYSLRGARYGVRGSVYSLRRRVYSSGGSDCSRNGCFLTILGTEFTGKAAEIIVKPSSFNGTQS